MRRMTVSGHGKAWRTQWLAGMLLVASVVLASSSLTWAIPVRTGDQKAGDQPCSGNAVGFLGITGMTCRACSLTLEDKGQNRAWSFGVEPQITEIAPDSPALRALSIGDTIVAIDGHLITTAEGGRRFANIEPGRDVTIRYRRAGRIWETAIHSEVRCWPWVEGVKAKQLLLSQVEVSGHGWSLDAPRVRLQFFESADGSKSSMTVSLPDGGAITVPRGRGSASLEERAPEIAEWRLLGISWSCRSCSGVMKSGRRVWKFSGPVQITKVEAGGPADAAGVRKGDQLTAVNGHRIESREGGEAFSDVQPWQPMRLTLRGPDGRARTLTVVPAATDSQARTTGQRTTIIFDRQRPLGEGAAPPSGFGFLGLNFSCGPCSSTWRDGREVWTFSGPVRVVGVEVGGPAHRAGIGLGEEIVAVDGKPIQSREGADAFTNLRPGQPTSFTLIGPDGRERTVTVVPGGRHNDESLD